MKPDPELFRDIVESFDAAMLIIDPDWHTCRASDNGGLCRQRLCEERGCIHDKLERLETIIEGE